MENSLSFLYIVFFIAIILHVVAGVIITMFVIPLQLKEAEVKNGLRLLRKQMLLKGFLSLTVIVVSVLALTLRYIVPDPIVSRYLIVALILAHAIGMLAKAIIDHKIYHAQYSQESLDMHLRIEKLEKGDRRRARAR